jgi:hypothetical protein
MRRWRGWRGGLGRGGLGPVRLVGRAGSKCWAAARVTLFGHGLPIRRISPTRWSLHPCSPPKLITQAFIPPPTQMTSLLPRIH